MQISTPTEMSRREQAATRQRVVRQMMPKKTFLLLAETFQALGDSSRIQIVWALSLGELSVGSIAEMLDMTQPQVSHHLRMLRNLHLVKKRKDGRTSFYSLDDEHINCILKSGIEHVDDLLK